MSSLEFCKQQLEAAALYGVDKVRAAVEDLMRRLIKEKLKEPRDRAALYAWAEGELRKLERVPGSGASKAWSISARSLNSRSAASGEHPRSFVSDGWRGVVSRFRWFAIICSANLGVRIDFFFDKLRRRWECAMTKCPSASTNCELWLDNWVP